ncbi:MAG: hypothetical protein VYB88_20095, partial [Pseudomonadota bacterium]|nr:hypothetical protein [Pseudomonadota bacterium]
ALPNNAAWYVTKEENATLKTLSFIAPKNWVQKNGAKRRCFSRENWLDWLIGRRLLVQQKNPLATAGGFQECGEEIA